MKKIALVTGLLLILIVGGYFSYTVYAEDQYYENYRLAVFNGIKSEQYYNRSTELLEEEFLTAETNDELKNASNKIMNELEKSKEYELKRVENINQMIFFAQKDYEKEYANSLLTQSNLTLEIYDEMMNHYKFVIGADLNDSVQIEKILNLQKSFMELLESNNKKMVDLANLREDIRALYPCFTEKLNKEVELAENATLN